MTNQSEKIESIQAELTELEKTRDELQVRIRFLARRLVEAKDDQLIYEAERALEDSQEFDLEDRD